MHRLLIIDDEYHVVDALSAFFADQTAVELEVLKAYTGSDAIAILRSCRVDVVLLDIQMPGMSGLDIYQIIVENWPACHVVFLTGNGRFEHLYQVNRNKRVAFLLKTESNAVILQAVRDAVDAIVLENKTSAMLSEAENRERLLTYVLDREMLRQAIQGADAAEIARVEALYPMKPRLRLEEPVFVLAIRIPVSAEDTQLHLLVLACMAKRLDSRFHLALAYAGKALLLIAAQENPASASQPVPADVFLSESLDSLVEGLADCVREAPIHVDLFRRAIPVRQLHSLYRLAQERCDSAYAGRAAAQSLGTLVDNTADALPHMGDSGISGLLGDMASDVQRHLTQGDTAQIVAALDAAHAAFAAQKTVDLLAIAAYQRITETFLRFIAANRLEEKLAADISLFPLYQPTFIHGWDDSFDYLRRLALAMMPLCESNRVVHTNALIQAILAYIEAHLSSELSLTMIASHINYTNSYISHLFKQEMGIPISAYVADVKLARAKEMLAHGSDSIHDIAEKLGFDTSQYFAMVFKKRTGLSPKDFRNQPRAPMG